MSGMSATQAAPRRHPDHEQFDALYRECASDVYAYVASLLRDRAAAEDVTALAFERALRWRGRFDATRGSERGWLFGIARNAALDELRRRRRTRALLGDAIDDAPLPGDDPDLAERRLIVRAGLTRLPPREREVILLKFLGRLTTAELAHALGTSETNAATRLSRALRRLREECDAPR
jgi:RNA polymerase sigma-70 factor (ECF subfamily)